MRGVFRDLHNDELISDCIIFGEYSNFPIEIYLLQVILLKEI